jgi:hypothetical protein
MHDAVDALDSLLPLLIPGSFSLPASRCTHYAALRNKRHNMRIKNGRMVISINAHRYRMNRANDRLCHGFLR